MKKKRGIMLSRIKSICFMSLVVFLTFGVVFAATSKSNAKKAYVTVLNEFAKYSRNAIDKFPEIDNKQGRVYVQNETNYGFDDENNKEDYEVVFDGKSYFVNDTRFKALVNENDNTIFITKVENGKDVGNVLTLDSSEGYSAYIPYNILSRLRKYTSNIQTQSKDYTESKEKLELCAIVLETISKNLKDEYFMDTASKDIKEYKLHMENKQIYELVSETIKDLNSNKRFMELMDEEPLTDEELKDGLKEIKSKIDNVKDLKLDISLFAKGNILSIIGGKVDLTGELNGEKFSYMLDLNSKGKTEIKKLESFDCSISMKAGKTSYNGNIIFNRKEIDVNFSSEYVDYERVYVAPSGDYAYLMGLALESKEVTRKIDGQLKISTGDNKEFLSSSDISALLSINNNGESQKFIVQLKGDSNNSFLKSKKVSVTYQMNDAAKVEFLVLEAEDNKEIENSSKVSLVIKVQGEEMRTTLEALDKKALKESSEIKLFVSANDKSEEIVKVIANDKKSLLDSTDITITFPYEITGSKTEVRIKSNDKKALKESTNVEVIYKGEIDYDEVNITVNIKSDKPFKEATKVEVNGKGTVNDKEVTLSVLLESLNQKPLRESNKFNFASEMKVDDENYEKSSFNSNKGYEIETKSNSDGYYSYSHVKYEYLTNVNMSKLLNTKNAKKVSSSEILKIIDPYYEENEEKFDLDSYLSSLGY